MDKEFKKEALKIINKTRAEIDYASDRLDDVERLIELNSEIESFLGDIADNETLPVDIRDKAHELWLTT